MEITPKISLRLNSSNKTLRNLILKFIHFSKKFLIIFNVVDLFKFVVKYFY